MSLQMQICNAQNLAFFFTKFMPHWATLARLVGCLILTSMLMTMKAPLHLTSFHTGYDSIATLPTRIAIRANRLASFHIISAVAILMVKGTPIAWILDAAIVLSVLCEFFLRFGE